MKETSRFVENRWGRANEREGTFRKILRLSGHHAQALEFNLFYLTYVDYLIFQEATLSVQEESNEEDMDYTLHLSEEEADAGMRILFFHNFYCLTLELYLTIFDQNKS